MNHDFAKVLPMRNYGQGYLGMHRGVEGRKFVLLLHRVVADACVPNPRPDIFDVVDHIDGNPLNNDPRNLRWVNSHLNHNNLATLPGRTPPGVHVCKRKAKSGKWYSNILFLKNGCCLKSFRSLQACVEFADDFNAQYFDRLYSAHLQSPEDPYQRRLYWAEKAICVSDFRAEMRKSRRQVLEGERFLVSDNLFKKLTLKQTQ